METLDTQKVGGFYAALEKEGHKPAALDYRLGCDGNLLLPAPVKVSAPEDIRSNLLKARSYYEDLNTEALNETLRELQGQLQTLANPYLFNDLLGSYLLLRSESALIQEDKKEAQKYLSLYGRILGPDAKINAALYTPTLREIFSQVRQQPSTEQGVLRVRLPPGISLKSARVAVDLVAQMVQDNGVMEISLPSGLHTLTLQAENILPSNRFLEIKPDQVTEIPWYPQPENAALKRKQWRELHSGTPLKELSAVSIAMFRKFQPGVHVLLIQDKTSLLLTPKKAHVFTASENKAQWAKRVKQLLSQGKKEDEPATASLSTGILMGVGAAAIVTLGVVIYMLSDESTVDPPEPIVGDDTGLATCCVGD